MTCHARGGNGRLTALRDCIEPAVDLLDHAHHLSRYELVALLVTGEIKLREWLPFATDVTELAANSEGAGEVAHGADDIHDGRRVRKNLGVDERVGWEFASRLRRGDRCNAEHKNDRKKSHRCSWSSGKS
jgi:hypothetical protein